MTKINKYDYVTIVGYYNEVALVNKRLRKTINNYSLDKLLEGHYYKESVALAVYEDSDELKNKVLDHFRKEHPVENFGVLERMFGISAGDLSKIKKIKRI